MTKKELSQLYWLNREIEMGMERLRELEAMASARRPKGWTVCPAAPVMVTLWPAWWLKSWT